MASVDHKEVPPGKMSTLAMDTPETTNPELAEFRWDFKILRTPGFNGVDLIRQAPQPEEKPMRTPANTSRPSAPTPIQAVMRPRSTDAHWQVAVREVSLPGHTRSLPHVFVAHQERLLFSGEVRSIRSLSATLLDAVQTTALIRMEWPRVLEVNDPDASSHIGTYLQSVVPLTIRRAHLPELDRLMVRLQRHAACDTPGYPEEDRPEEGATPEFVAAMLRDANPPGNVHSESRRTRASKHSPRLA